MLVTGILVRLTVSPHRYKYLQRPLEDTSLPTLLQYLNKWSDAQKEKLAIATALLMSQGLASASCLQSLTKDHLVKNGTQPCVSSRPQLIRILTQMLRSTPSRRSSVPTSRIRPWTTSPVPCGAAGSRI